MTDKPRIIPESKISINPVIIDDSYREKPKPKKKECYIDFRGREWKT